MPTGKALRKTMQKLFIGGKKLLNKEKKVR